MTVHYERIPSTDPRLNRHIRHDERSRLYPFNTTGLSIVSAKHERRIPVLDQGNLGSCTGNAGIGCLGTEPFFDGKIHHYTRDESGAVTLYGDATKADDYPGQYPPDDTGSDGLTIAKVLTAAGEISGYTHTFTLDDALKALGVTPVITGVTWYNSMFGPAPDGKLTVDAASGVAGGHEFVVDEIDAEHERVWMTNSWGTSWGVDGRAYLTFADWGTLLADSGDVTVFTPLTQPAPTPTPADPADVAFATAFRQWAKHPRIFGSAKLKAAGQAWLTAKNL